jgi:hypothetical protein
MYLTPLRVADFTFLFHATVFTLRVSPSQEDAENMTPSFFSPFVAFFIATSLRSLPSCLQQASLCLRRSLEIFLA